MILIPGTTASARPVRALLAAALSVAVAAGTLTLTAAPAEANAWRYEQNSSWAFTDAHRPTKITIDQAGDVAVGSWKDDRGRPHTSRAYFTFDISRYRGADIESAVFSAKETSAVDCTKRPGVELWRTAPYTARSSWAKPPAELAKLHTTTLPDIAGCPAPYVEWSAVEGLRQALAEGASTLTLALRLPAEVEADPTLGRRYASTVGISIDYNYPPGVPTELQTSGKPCTAAEPYQLQLRGDLGLSAVLHDQNLDETGSTDLLTVTVALWPVDEPAARIERTGIGHDGERESVVFPGDTFTHDRVYAWQVRAADSRATGEWSALCYFRTDFQGPAVAPTVTSTDFPIEGWHPALPGQFTFDAGATPDAVGFRYQLNGNGYQTVSADRPGGSATVTLTPRTGPNGLSVMSVDSAGNWSPEVRYEFRASDVSPIITGKLTEIGVPATFTVQPQMAGVVRYRFQLDGDPEQTVEAAADGTASVTWAPTKPGFTPLTVWSVNRDGTQSDSASFTFLVRDLLPVIQGFRYDPSYPAGGPGQPGDFWISSEVAGTTEFRYRFDDGPEQGIGADINGSAIVTWTPEQAGTHTLTVRSLFADGTASPERAYTFLVAEAEIGQ